MKQETALEWPIPGSALPRSPGGRLAGSKPGPASVFPMPGASFSENCCAAGTEPGPLNVYAARAVDDRSRNETFEGGKTMCRARTGGSRIIKAVASAWAGKRTFVHIALGWLLVMALSACGEEDYEPAVTAAAPATGAPATTAAEYSPATTEVMVEADSYAATTTVAATMAPATTAAAATYAPAEEAMEAEAEAPADLEVSAAPNTNAYRLSEPAPSATNFRDYQQSRFVSTAQDRTSTFSLDTDRTSFQLALNWARAGFEVDPDSVRAEEWINAFNYGYQHPTHLDSFEIITDLVRHPLDDRKHLARIGFQAPDFRDDRPLNVTLVLDASGSMREGGRVAIAREAAETIRQGLRSRDRIAVVHFTDEVIDRFTVDHRRPEDREVRDSIGRLAPHDSTNVQAGLNEGVWLADRIRRERPDAYNYIILMSDGVANVDATDPFAILESAYGPDTGNPLRLITIGVGISNYNDYLLEQLAQHGNGWYRYLNDVHLARSMFSRDNWLALSTPFADQTRAQIIWNDQVVKSWRMIGYENRVTSDESFVENRKEFAEIPVGAATTVFYELELTDRVWRNPRQTVELADVDLRWVTPVGGMSNRQGTVMELRPDMEFHAAHALLQFGSVVALASDRYASLPYVESGSADVGNDLWALVDRLRPLGQHLGDLDSFNDFAFVLDHIVAAVPGGSSGGSGYSR